jgi:xylulokinase
VCLPHDWLTWQLAGATGIDAVVTDRGDASGTGYFSAADDRYRPELLALALGERKPLLPRVAGPSEAIGAATQCAEGALLGPGTGDNAAAALALDAREGDVVVSIGTSGVVAAVASIVAHDTTGEVAAFADATGRQLPLVCTLNGAPVLDATAKLLGVDHARLAELALAQPSEGLVLVPYLAGERTPDRPDATGALHGLRLGTSTPGHLARAAVEGLLCGLADGIDRLRAQGIRTDRVLLIGGAAASAAVRAVAPALFGAPVSVPSPAEYVALGAARQAAWALRGGAEPPAWPVAETDAPGDPTPAVLDRYGSVRSRAGDLLTG